MPNADITLDGENCFIEGNWLKVHCLDIHLDAPSRRSSASGARRALVHGFSDELVINFADDYPGGVSIRGIIAIPGKIKQNHLRLESHDLHLDHPDRRSNTSGSRRALVHGFNDELVLDWAKDYPGGVVSHGNFEVQKSSSLRMRNSAGNLTATLDNSGNLYLGGNNTDGDVICKNGDDKTVFHLDSQYRRMDLRDDGGATKIRICTDDFTDSEWPTLPGESTPSHLDLVAEIRKLKEEIITLREQVDALTP